jgi:hypothetical protein
LKSVTVIYKQDKYVKIGLLEFAASFDAEIQPDDSASTSTATSAEAAAVDLALSIGFEVAPEQMRPFKGSHPNHIHTLQRCLL